MKKKNLIERWKSKEGQALLNELLTAILRKKPFEKISGLEIYQGRWDFRGAILSTLTKERKVEANGYGFTAREGCLKLKNCELESIDFSYCDMSYSLIINCNITNCLFEATQAQELNILGSNFLDCIFRKTNLSYSFMNKNIGANSGSFINISFEDVNLRETSFCFPIVENCIFKNCNLMAANFDGSRFKNTTFIGKIDSSWFRGYSTNASKSILGIFNRVDPKKYPNTMENVDFSEATLIGVTFSHAIDISKCKFPQGDDYIMINSLKDVMNKARSIIEFSWQGEYKRRALALIDNLYFNKNKQDQLKDIIDTFPVPSSDPNFEKKFFELIRNSC